MTLWRLEVLRLGRTHRWMVIAGVYLLFGVVGPLTAAYLQDILARFGGEITIIAPDPRPADGIGQFVANASQLGLLAVLVVAAGALAFDARPEAAAFLRTRVTRARDLLVPRYVVSVAAAAGALVLGTATAWLLTAGLIGAVSTSAMLVGTLHGVLYLAFAIAVLAAAAGFTQGQASAVFAAIALLVLLPLVGLLPPVKPWLPSELLASVAALVDGRSAGDYTRSVVVTLASTAGLLALASARLERREL